MGAIDFAPNFKKHTILYMEIINICKSESLGVLFNIEIKFHSKKNVIIFKVYKKEGKYILFSSGYYATIDCDNLILSKYHRNCTMSHFQCDLRDNKCVEYTLSQNQKEMLNPFLN